ncbi:hypothetical protein B0H14DRAFT_1171953 [Mycena olivaceomarginata]|nr:hypothetical protein B0H14DRAFT_1171953 [Mycena olivaceomarginata]
MRPGRRRNQAKTCQTGCSYNSYMSPGTPHARCDLRTVGGDPDNLESILVEFHSVIDVPNSTDCPVVIFHASFPDYMTDSRRSESNTLDTDTHHAVLAFQCIECMNSLLHENMCRIARTDLTDSIAENVLSHWIPAHLRYASIYWGTHLALMSSGPSISTLKSEFEAFTKTHILHWLECMSLIGKMHLASDSIQKAIIFASSQDLPNIRDLLDDVRRMLPQIFGFASIYPLEVYYSALEWLPICSTLRRTYTAGKHPCIVAGLHQQWDNCELILDHNAQWPCVAISPDAAHVVSTASDNNAYIWAINTGQMHTELRGTMIM